MARLLRWAVTGLGSLVVLALIAATALWFTSSQKLHAAVEPKAEHLA